MKSKTTKDFHQNINHYMENTKTTLSNLLFNTTKISNMNTFSVLSNSTITKLPKQMFNKQNRDKQPKIIITSNTSQWKGYKNKKTELMLMHPDTVQIQTNPSIEQTCYSRYPKEKNFPVASKFSTLQSRLSIQTVFIVFIVVV